MIFQRTIDKRVSWQVNRWLATCAILHLQHLLQSRDCAIHKSFIHPGAVSSIKVLLVFIFWKTLKFHKKPWYVCTCIGEYMWHWLRGHLGPLPSSDLQQRWPWRWIFRVLSYWEFRTGSQVGFLFCFSSICEDYSRDQFLSKEGRHTNLALRKAGNLFEE